jgi:hypothetical protein
MRDVLVFPYPATSGTTGTLVSRKEFFPITGYVPNNLAFVDKYTKVYDQNLIIYSFRELKNHLGTEGNDLYKKLVRLAVIQSGLTNSPISFTALLPYEDFKEEYNETISKLDIMPNLAEFQTLGVFQRNNWSNSTIVDSSKAKWKKSKKGNWYSKPHAPSEMTFLNSKLQNAISRGIIPQLLNFSTLSSEGRSEFLVFSWEKAEYSKDQKKEMRKKGNYSYINKGLFRKVYDKEGKPLIQTSTDKEGKVYENFVYKAINAWGDSFRANEFYTIPTVSKLENGFVKVKTEVEDIIIDDILNKAAVPMPPQVIPAGVQTKTIQAPAPVTSRSGVEISSNAKGLAAALTNPTELSKSKGNLTESYPVKFRGKDYKDAEAAYQALKSTATKDNGPNNTYNLMVDIIKAKLQQHPRLINEITKQGGSKWILS